MSNEIVGWVCLLYIMWQGISFLVKRMHWRPRIIRLNLVEPKQDFWEQVWTLHADKY